MNRHGAPYYGAPWREMSGPFATFPSKQPKKGFPGRCCATTGRAAERAEPSRAEERESADDEPDAGEARPGEEVAPGRLKPRETTRLPSYPDLHPPHASPTSPR